MPFHDADVHGGGRLWHRRSLPLRRVALDAAALHRLQEPKAAARSAWGAGNPPKGQHRPHSPSPCPPLGVTQLKVSRGKRERARSPGWAPVFAARIPRSARLLPHFPRQGGSRPAPQPHHFLHPVKLRRWPRSHVHMVRNACGKLKKTNGWLLRGASGCVSSTRPSVHGTETQLRLHDGKPHTNFRLFAICSVSAQIGSCCVTA